MICFKGTVEHSGLKKRAGCISNDFHEFKIYVHFFIILYSILHCQVHQGLKDNKRSVGGFKVWEESNV